MKTARDTCPLLSLIRSFRASHAHIIINMYLISSRNEDAMPLLSHPIWPNRIMYFHNTWHTAAAEWTDACSFTGSG